MRARLEGMVNSSFFFFHECLGITHGSSCFHTRGTQLCTYVGHEAIISPEEARGRSELQHLCGGRGTQEPGVRGTRQLGGYSFCHTVLKTRVQIQTNKKINQIKSTK